MKRSFFLIFCLCIVYAVNCQELSAGDLVSLSTLSLQKFDQAIGKKGFSKAELSDRNEAVVHVYRQKIRSETQAQRYAERYQAGKEQFMVFKTSSVQEFLSIRQQLKTEGFFYGVDTLPNDSKEILFQKKNIAVLTGRVIENADTLYSFRFQYKILPNPSAVSYADDLLQFTSHQHLISMFGSSNVLKDVYYFTDNEISACSVLFPNSSRQAVFIWKDETNLTDLSSVIVGGGLRVGDDINYASHITENTWMLRNGIHPNMSMRKLIEMNGRDFHFYGKDSPYFMKVMPESNGAVNFKETTVILGCLNCNGISLFDAVSVSAADAVDRNLAMHVLMMILTPSDNNKEKEETTGDK
jgi:hypothetical protein